MLSFLLISIFIPLFCYGTPVETVHFQIIRKHKIVGQFSAQKSKVGALTVYQSNCALTANPLRVRISYEIKVVLKNGVLEETDLKVTINGRLRTHSQTKKNGEMYTFFRNGKAKEKIHDVITHTTIMLYFNEPLGIRKTHSEERGSFCKILSAGPDTYHKINAKGNKNTYRYNNKLLRHLLIETTMVNFEMMAESVDI